VTKLVQVLRYATPDGKVSERKGLYWNLIIQKVINIVWFAKRLDEGVVNPKFFYPIPLPTIALVLTAVSFCSFLIVRVLTPSCE
jgi:hypothetical protein